MGFIHLTNTLPATMLSFDAELKPDTSILLDLDVTVEAYVTLGLPETITVKERGLCFVIEPSNLNWVSNRNHFTFDMTLIVYEDGHKVWTCPFTDNEYELADMIASVYQTGTFATTPTTTVLRSEMVHLKRFETNRPSVLIDQGITKLNSLAVDLNMIKEATYFVNALIRPETTIDLAVNLAVDANHMNRLFMRHIGYRGSVPVSRTYTD